MVPLYLPSLARSRGCYVLRVVSAALTLSILVLNFVTLFPPQAKIFPSVKNSAHKRALYEVHSSSPIQITPPDTPDTDIQHIQRTLRGTDTINRRHDTRLLATSGSVASPYYSYTTVLSLALIPRFTTPQSSIANLNGMGKPMSRQPSSPNIVLGTPSKVPVSQPPRAGPL